MARVERVVTSGTFNLDGGSWAVDNNVWLVGGDDEVLIVDAAHDTAAILAAVGGRRVVAIVCTHAHDDHINVAPELADATGAPVRLHPEDEVLWKRVHPDFRFTALADGEVVRAGGTELRVVHTPGHAPGAVCLYAPELTTVFSGDTLFAGGPGATGRSFSDFGTIITSIRERLLTLPPETLVRPGHGDDTTIGAEMQDLDAWIARGH